MTEFSLLPPVVQVFVIIGGLIGFVFGVWLGNSYIRKRNKNGYNYYKKLEEYINRKM